MSFLLYLLSTLLILLLEQVKRNYWNQWNTNKQMNKTKIRNVWMNAKVHFNGLMVNEDSSLWIFDFMRSILDDSNYRVSFNARIEFNNSNETTSYRIRGFSCIARREKNLQWKCQSNEWMGEIYWQAWALIFVTKIGW